MLIGDNRSQPCASQSLSGKSWSMKWPVPECQGVQGSQGGRKDPREQGSNSQPSDNTSLTILSGQFVSKMC